MAERMTMTMRTAGLILDSGDGGERSWSSWGRLILDDHSSAKLGGAILKGSAGLKP